MRHIIGEHDRAEFPLDRAAYRAYFYWREGDVEHHRSFSAEELETHIRECTAKGQPTGEFELALGRLRQMNRWE